MGFSPRETAYNLEYQFERRRYNGRTFTWLHWRKRTESFAPENPWNTYGDPWPSVRISKADLREALDNIRFSLLKAGTKIRIGTGATAEVVGLDFIKLEAEVIVETIPGRTFVIPASQVVEILEKISTVVKLTFDLGILRTLKRHDAVFAEDGMIKGYKLLRVRRNGTLGPLFIDRATVIPIGVWLESRPVPTQGFAYRPGWHACSKKLAPHLSKKGRVWCKVSLHGIQEHYRPTSQGGLWYTAKQMRVDKVLG